MNRIPFVAYFKIVPERGSGKRFEIVRSRERIAHLIWGDLYTTLENESGTGPGINMAAPGGAVHWGLAVDADSLASTVNAVSVKPQMGEFPDTVTVVGFYDDDSAAVPYGEKTLISVGKVWKGPASGPKGYSTDTMPSAANAAACKALKTSLEAAITSVDVQTIKMDVGGVIYGHGGMHFPL